MYNTQKQKRGLVMIGILLILFVLANLLPGKQKQRVSPVPTPAPVKQLDYEDTSKSFQEAKIKDQYLKKIPPDSRIRMVKSDFKPPIRE